MRRFASRSLVSRLGLLRVLFLCCLVAILAGPAPAQSTFGAILGTVRDNSGALVVGAQVTLTNSGTTATRAAVTDDNPVYSSLDAAKAGLSLSQVNLQNQALIAPFSGTVK